jgi:dTDP-glucose 4,6-dehydratase
MHKEHNFPAVIIRPFNAYGPNVTQPYIVPEIALQLLTSNDHIRLGNIESSRDFTYVSDTARGMIAALVAEKAVGETINLGSGRATKIKELAFIMASILGKKVAIEVDASRLRPYDVDTLACDNRKALKLLNWKPEIPLEEGLRKTLEWISKTKISFKLPFRGWPATYYRNLSYKP